MKFKSNLAAPILLIVVFGLVTLSRFIPAARLAANENPYLAAIVIQLLIFALPSLFFCTLRGSEYRSRLRLRLMPLSSIIFMIAAAALLVTGSFLLGTLMYSAAPEAFKSSSPGTYAAFAMNPGVFDGMYLVLAFALLPAITEEVLFRGIILTEYTSYGVACAVIMSSLTFAMSHFSFVRLPIYLFCGLILALVTFATRSLIASVIVHLVNNIFVLFFEDYVVSVAKRQNISSILALFILLSVAFIAAIVMAFEASSIYRSYGKNNADSSYLPDPGEKRSRVRAFSEAFFSPAFLILLVLWAAVTYLT